MKRTALLLTLLSLAASSPMMTVARAAEEHKHEAGKAAKIPDTLSGIWHEVKEHEEALGKTIAAKKLAQVHENAFEIRDLVNALPEKSKMVIDAARLGRVKTNAKFVAALATRLDESGDSNDQAATEANFKKLQQILKTIESLYPPASLKEDMKDMKM